MGSILLMEKKRQPPVFPTLGKTHHGGRQPGRSDRANVARARRPEPGKSNASQRLRWQPRPGILNASIYHKSCGRKYKKTKRNDNRQKGGERPIKESSQSART